jgi:hypothetical protein
VTPRSTSGKVASCRWASSVLCASSIITAPERSAFR